MKQAIILAAGEGQRLRPFTVNKPKVMLSIAGKPVLQHVIEALVANGIDNIVIVVGYKREQIYNYFGDGKDFGANIHYAEQEKQLGTAQALLKAKEMAQSKFIVLPGDNLIEKHTIANFVKQEPWAVLTKEIEKPFRNIMINVEGNRVKETNLKERRNYGPNREEGTHLINTGIYSFYSEIFNHIDKELGIPMVLDKMIEQGRGIKALVTSSLWLDIIYPWNLLNYNAAILKDLEPKVAGIIEPGSHLLGQVEIGKNTIIRSGCYISGPVIIGNDCDIGPSTCILPFTSIGNNVNVNSFTRMKNSLIGNDVAIGANSDIEDSVIDSGCRIKGHFMALADRADIKIDDTIHNVTAGAMVGEGCQIESCVLAMPGTIIGINCKINQMKVVSGYLRNNSQVV